MNFIKNLYDTIGNSGISGLWSVFTDSGVIDGVKQEFENFTIEDESLTGEDLETCIATMDAGAFALKSHLEMTPEGLLIRDDEIVNNSDKTITVNRAYSRFRLPDGEYEAYTQWNASIQESEGEWQPLVTTASAECLGARTNCGATPMMALFNKQNAHGYAFYIFGNCMWKISAHNTTRMKYHMHTIELGVNEKGFNYKLLPGEALQLPRIIVSPFTSKIDLDCDKLHKWFNRVYPRRELPVIYNTWMAFFDRPKISEVFRDVELAASIGCEYFVQDAGWFGHGDFWSMAVGDWEEKEDGRYKGRLIDLADKVRAKGMKFGLWFEMERARDGAPIVHERPEWFFRNGDIYLLDFGNEEARCYATKTVIDAVKRYGIEFLKFDFNTDFSYDPTGNGFLKYNEGYKKHVMAVREACPGIYIEGCASGGYRSELYNATIFDSFWISDNQSPYNEVKITKETMKRMCMNSLEKWPVFNEAKDVVNYETGEKETKLIACHDSIWGNAVTTNESWLRAYTIGSPLGISLVLGNLSEPSLDMLKRVIDFYKEHRESYKTMHTRILEDTKAVTVIQKTAEDGTAYINVFAWAERQRWFDVYPILDNDREYKVTIIADGFYTKATNVIDGTSIKAGEALHISSPFALHAATIMLK